MQACTDVTVDCSKENESTASDDQTNYCLSFGKYTDVRRGTGQVRPPTCYRYTLYIYIYIYIYIYNIYIHIYI